MLELTNQVLCAGHDGDVAKSGVVSASCTAADKLN
jgi:hypothetical protein